MCINIFNALAFDTFLSLSKIVSPFPVCRIDGLVESNAGRMESLKAQQLDFAQKLSSLEHIQRLSRSTLDELKGERDAVFGPRAVRQLKYKRKNRARLPGKPHRELP